MNIIEYAKFKKMFGGSGGSGGGTDVVKEKDVNFYDYDGTLLHSFTLAEAQALTELPTLPEHEGLIAQEWNYDLETIKSYNRAVDIGATYITDDGKTRLYITLDAEKVLDVSLYISQTVANGVTIDWGDGSATETLDGTGNITPTHTSASVGDYMITLTVTDGCVLGFSKINYCVMGEAKKEITPSRLLTRVEIGSGVNVVSSYAFQRCISLEAVTIPNSIKNILSYAFQECKSLKCVIVPKSANYGNDSTFMKCTLLNVISLPDGITYLSQNMFNNCISLKRITIPNTVTGIGSFCFAACYSLQGSLVIPNGITSLTNSFSNLSSVRSIVIPPSVMTIGASAFTYLYALKYFDFTSHESVPTLFASSITSIPNDCEIRVPAALYDEWIAATNWATYADYIVAVEA
jgi:hypothetical protein